MTWYGDALWDEAMAHLPSLEPLPADIGTAHLPDEVVRQDVTLWFVHSTNPEDPREGASRVGIRIGARELADPASTLTEQEAEYVYRLIMHGLLFCLGAKLRHDAETASP